MATCNLMGLDPVDRREFDRDYGDRMAKGCDPAHAMRMVLLEIAGRLAKQAKATEAVAEYADHGGSRQQEMRDAAALRSRATSLLAAADSVRG